ncbi:MAG: hypothetical protein ACLR8P_06145 [Clostridium fessum]
MVRYFRSGQSEAFRLEVFDAVFRSAFGAAENLNAGFAQGDHHRDRKGVAEENGSIFFFRNSTSAPGSFA